jgi:hypothetical protein
MPSITEINMNTLIRSGAALIALAFAIGLYAPPAEAGYLDTSPNWSAPQQQPMSKRHVLAKAQQCGAVNARVAEGGKAGALIVAGPHPTNEDKKTHITVRLYNKNGEHDRSCHVYVTRQNEFNGCNCRPAN